MNVCFSFRRMAMRKLIYPGGEDLEKGKYTFWRKILFRKSGKKSGIAFPLTGGAMLFCYKGKTVEGYIKTACKCSLSRI